MNQPFGLYGAFLLNSAMGVDASASVGSAETNQMTLPLNETNGAMFFWLMRP